MTRNDLRGSPNEASPAMSAALTALRSATPDDWFACGIAGGVVAFAVFGTWFAAAVVFLAFRLTGVVAGWRAR